MVARGTQQAEEHGITQEQLGERPSIGRPVSSRRRSVHSGRACLAGWLGGLDPIADFNPLLQMARGVYLTFFGSFVFGTPGFPLSDVPLQEIAEQVAEGRLKAKPSRVSGFEQVREAHRLMEANEAKGKMVVVNA
ncbi:zinc-binding dehydrogenase [Nonomuraea rubra]|uniref:zinc-binding dehydrogenase n=1 Tax=Nonomuraea rubra TaxID=46180 RepID=UPI0033F68B56